MLLVIDARMLVHAYDASLSEIETVSLLQPLSPLSASTSAASAPLTISHASLARSISFTDAPLAASLDDASASAMHDVLGPNALCCDGRSLYLIGTAAGGCALLGVRALTWLEWLSALGRSGRWLEAFAAACELVRARVQRNLYRCRYLDLYRGPVPRPAPVPVPPPVAIPADLTTPFPFRSDRLAQVRADGSHLRLPVALASSLSPARLTEIQPRYPRDPEIASSSPSASTEPSQLSAEVRAHSGSVRRPVRRTHTRSQPSLSPTASCSYPTLSPKSIVTHTLDR